MGGRDTNRNLKFRPFEGLAEKVPDQETVSDETPTKLDPQPSLWPQAHPDTSDPLLDASLLAPFQDQARMELRRCLAEAEELQRENRWGDLLAMFYPLEDKVPLLVDSNLDLELRLKVAFALGQEARFEEALKCLKSALVSEPDSFLVHAAIGFNAYQSLLRRQARKVSLIPEKRAERIRLAHQHFERCQEIRPDSVTAFYREGMLFKEVERKTIKASGCFRQAIANWEGLSDEDKTRRHQEYPKYVRSLYHLASCLLDNGEYRRALKVMERCITEDRKKGVLSDVHKHFAKAKILYALGSYKEALEHLETAGHAARPGEPTDYIWELAARCSLMLGRPEQGMDYIKRIPEEKRKHYVRWTEADLLVSLGRHQTAESVLTSSMERDRRSRHKALMRLANLSYRQGETGKALEYADSANRFCQETFGNPSPEALFWKAACLLRLGRLAEARTALQELARRNPSYPYLRKLRAQIEQAMEEHDDGKGPSPTGKPG